MRSLTAAFALGFALLLVTSSARAERYVILVNSSGFSFSPARLNALTGDQIVWTWTGPFPHTVTEDTGLLDSGLHTMPFRFRRILNVPGDYFYHCTQHGAPGGVGMAGVLHIGTRDHDDDDD